jgi:hypothetical protein
VKVRNRDAARQRGIWGSGVEQHLAQQSSHSNISVLLLMKIAQYNVQLADLMRETETNGQEVKLTD